MSEKTHSIALAVGSYGWGKGQDIEAAILRLREEEPNSCKFKLRIVSGDMSPGELWDRTFIDEMGTLIIPEGAESKKLPDVELNDVQSDAISDAMCLLRAIAFNAKHDLGPVTDEDWRS